VIHKNRLLHRNEIYIAGIISGLQGH